eukprot:5836389-Amphidinium_carterae.1
MVCMSAACIPPPPGLEAFGSPLFAKLNEVVSDCNTEDSPRLSMDSEFSIPKEQPSTVHETMLSGFWDDADRPLLNLPTALAKSMVAEAQQLLTTASSVVPTVEALLLWIRACDKVKDPTLAYALYKYIVQHYGLPGRTWSLESDVCNAMLGAFCKGGQPEYAVRFFWHMFEVGVCPTTTGVCLAISAFVKTKAYGEAAV